MDSMRLIMSGDAQIRKILRECRTIVVVGCSRDPSKDAHAIPQYLKEKGYRIVPVNPFADEILGERCYKSLTDIPFSIDVIDIFRPSDQVEPVVDEALRTKAKVIWMQLGIRNERAAQKARKAGMEVIMDRCMKLEHQRLMG